MAATVANWIAYAQARGDSVEAGVASEAALVRAQDYIAHHYLNRTARTVPEEVQDNATYEAAKLELATPGFFSKTYTPDQQKVLTKVDGIEWTVRGEASGAEAATPVSTKIEGMMYPYIGHKTGIMVI